jgi:hypothetical protein
MMTSKKPTAYHQKKVPLNALFKKCFDKILEVPPPLAPPTPVAGIFDKGGEIWGRIGGDDRRI